MATAGGQRGPGPERAHAPALPEGGDVTLGAAESAHLVRVRRVRAGDEVVLFDGRGRTRLGRLTEADPRAAVVTLLGPYPDRTPARLLRLAVSLPEAGRADRMVSALAELGTATFAPLLCARTPPKRREVGSHRLGRWERLAIEAAKVSGCGRLMEIGPPLAFAEATRAGALLLDPDPACPPLSVAILEGRLDVKAPPWLLVGPEGGFDEDERDATTDAQRYRLVQPALRVETAAVAAAAIALAGA